MDTPGLNRFILISPDGMVWMAPEGKIPDLWIKAVRTAEERVASG
jgi:hypothetical protein